MKGYALAVLSFLALARAAPSQGPQPVERDLSYGADAAQRLDLWAPESKGFATVMFVPAGLAGLVVMHRPAWRFGRLHRLVAPYARAGILALVAAVGIIGVLEMVQFLVSGPAGRVTKRLFWVAVPVYSVWPWVIFAALALGGALALRRAAPAVAAAFNEASRPPAAPRPCRPPNRRGRRCCWTGSDMPASNPTRATRRPGAGSRRACG